MGKKEYFAVYVDKEVKKKFMDKVNEKYHRGKIQEVIENFMREFATS